VNVSAGFAYPLIYINSNSYPYPYIWTRWGKEATEKRPGIEVGFSSLVVPQEFKVQAPKNRFIDIAFSIEPLTLFNYKSALLIIGKGIGEYLYLSFNARVEQYDCMLFSGKLYPWFGGCSSFWLSDRWSGEFMINFPYLEPPEEAFSSHPLFGFSLNFRFTER